MIEKTNPLKMTDRKIGQKIFLKDKNNESIKNHEELVSNTKINKIDILFKKVENND